MKKSPSGSGGTRTDNTFKSVGMCHTSYHYYNMPGAFNQAKHEGDMA